MNSPGAKPGHRRGSLETHTEEEEAASVTTIVVDSTIQILDRDKKA